MYQDIYKHPGSMQDALRGDPQQQFGPMPGEQDAQYQQQLAALLRGTREGGQPQDAQQQQQGVDPGQAYDMYNKFAGGSAAGGQAGASSALDTSMAANEGGMWGSGISGNAGGASGAGGGSAATAGPAALLAAFYYWVNKKAQQAQHDTHNSREKRAEQWVDAHGYAPYQGQNVEPTSGPMSRQAGFDEYWRQWNAGNAKAAAAKARRTQWVKRYPEHGQTWSGAPKEGGG